MTMPKLDNIFISHACDILADTNSGLSGSKNIEYCNSYAIDYDKVIPHSTNPFEAPNKRTALRENLMVFEAKEQFCIIKELCDLSCFSKNERVKELKENLYKRYGTYSDNKISETQLVQKTKHWLDNYPESLIQYENALSKYESGIFQRNTLDDMRLSFELLVKSLLNNNKSLENQIREIGSRLNNANASPELCNMIVKIITYYTDFQNHHIKHDDSVNEDEIEYIIELTSVVMKYLIKVIGGTLNDKT